MTHEETLAIRKEFRKYLRTREGITGADLDTVIRAAEEHVTPLVREQFIPGFTGLYEDSLDLTELLRLARKIERNERVMARRQGYACLRAVSGYARFFADKNGLRLEDYMPEEEPDFPVPDEELSLHEGTEYESRGIRYERDKDARNICIAYYKNQDSENKCRCQVCGMSFEDVYGEKGRDFIEVHHIVPISERGGDYVVKPTEHLIPLCSNCHSMIHHAKLSVPELRRLFEEHSSLNR